MLSPFVGTREFCVLRYCQQIEHGTWAIVNVSYDFPQFISHSRSYRLPSGCLIQGMSNGYSKVCNRHFCFSYLASRVVWLYV